MDRITYDKNNITVHCRDCGRKVQMNYGLWCRRCTSRRKFGLPLFFEEEEESPPRDTSRDLPQGGPGFEEESEASNSSIRIEPEHPYLKEHDDTVSSFLLYDTSGPTHEDIERWTLEWLAEGNEITVLPYSDRNAGEKDEPQCLYISKKAHQHREKGVHEVVWEDGKRNIIDETPNLEEALIKEDEWANAKQREKDLRGKRYLDFILHDPNGFDIDFAEAEGIDPSTVWRMKDKMKGNRHLLNFFEESEFFLQCFPNEKWKRCSEGVGLPSSHKPFAQETGYLF